MCVCVCVCVLEIHVLKILNWETILRDYCVDWIISWVACWIAFMSVFFSSLKTVFKMWLYTSSIPPRHLTICRVSKAFLYCNPESSSIPGGLIKKAGDSFSTPGGSIELLFLDLMNCCLILSRYLSCRQAFSRHLPRQLPQHLLTPHLSSFTEGSI